MGIFQNILNKTGLFTERQVNNLVTEAVKKEIEKVYPWMGETADAQQWSIPDPLIFANQADLYRLSPILGTALDILAGDIGTAKFNVKRMVGEDERDIPNHEFELKLRTPNPFDSGLELMQDTVSNYKLNGNSIWWLNRKTWLSPVDEIWTIPFGMIKPVPVEKKYLSHYEYYPGNGKEPLRFETWEIVHFKKYNPANRFVGLSPLESLISTITGDLAMRETNKNNYTEYNGTPPGILAFKEFVPNDAWKDIKNEKREAAKRNEMMMLRGVGDGVTWMQRALSNRDNDFIGTLRQNMTDVFNRMCPGLLSMLSENATEANALAARATYSEKTLWVMMETIAQKITSDILPAYGRKLKGEFDDPRVVDRKLELEEQTAYERSHTIVEVREKYYQDEPIGDERDDLMVSQLNATSGGIQKPPVQKVAQPQENQQTNDDDESEQPQENVTEETQQDSVSMKAIADLAKWRRMTLRGKEKAKDFTSSYIPVSVMSTVKAKIETITDKDVLARVFDIEIDKMKPKEKLDPVQILRGIELGVKALEMKG